MNKMLGMSGLPVDLDPIDIARSVLPLTIAVDIHITEAEIGDRKGIAIAFIPRENKNE